MSDLMLINIPELVTCAGTAPKCGKEMSDIGRLVDAYIVITQGIIDEVGLMKDYPEAYLATDREVIDCSDHAVLPGFIDSHTHFIYGGNRADEFKMRLEGVDYMDIMKAGGGIVSTVNATRKADFGTLLAAGRKRLDAMLDLGVTTVEGKSGYGLDMFTELKQLKVMKSLNENHAMDVVATFLGPHSVPVEYRGRSDEFIAYMIEEVLPCVVDEGLAEFGDIFCEEGVFSVEQSRKFLTAVMAKKLKGKIHADEIVQLGGAELAAELGITSADHLLAASDQGIMSMAAAGVMTTLLPATAFSLKENYANARKMIDYGCAVALATDFNPGSCPTHSIPLVIALSAMQMKMTIEEIIIALTINAAAAIGRETSIGSVEVGKKADLILLNKPSINFLPYHMGMNLVEIVIKDGLIVVGQQHR